MSEAERDVEFTVDELAVDEELRERLRSSLDVVGPSEEAEERMLANLLAAQEARAVTVEGIELPEVTVIEGGKRGRGASRRRGLALAAAAALAALALGVGVLSGGRAAQRGEMLVQSYDAGAAATSEGVDAKEVVADEAVSEEAAEDVASGELLASGGAFDETGDPSYELAVTYPEVRLYSGEVLRVEEHDGGPVIIEEKWVEQLVGEAEAFTDDGFESVGCWVYRLPASDDGLFAVRYIEGGSCFAIRLVE